MRGRGESEDREGKSERDERGGRIETGTEGRRRKANNPIKEIKKVVRIVKLGSTTINIRQVGCSFIFDCSSLDRTGEGREVGQ